MEMDAGGGGGSGDFYQPRFTNVDVVPGDLLEFAGLVGNDHQALQEAWLRALDDLGRQHPPNLGGEDNGMFEGAEFLRAYWLTLGAQLELMNDALAGLEVVRSRANMIHDEYLHTDQAGAAGVEGGFEAYEKSVVEAAFDTPAFEGPPFPAGGSDDG